MTPTLSPEEIERQLRELADQMEQSDGHDWNSRKPRAAADALADLSRDRDRYKALAEGERERCAHAFTKLTLFGWIAHPDIVEQVVDAIRSLPAPTLPEETGDA
jgi:hypothetical protein